MATLMTGPTPFPCTVLTPSWLTQHNVRTQRQCTLSPAPVHCQSQGAQGVRAHWVRSGRYSALWKPECSLDISGLLINQLSHWALLKARLAPQMTERKKPGPGHNITLEVALPSCAQGFVCRLPKHLYHCGNLKHSSKSPGLPSSQGR